MLDTKDQEQKERENREAAAKTSPEEKNQQRTDPNITELKGFIDPDKDLEPKGTDNKV